MSEHITILTPGTTTNRYGDAVDDWENATSRTVCATCFPLTTAENNDKRSTTITGLGLLFRTECPPELAHTCRVVARGETWEVDGDIADWRSPWGWRPGHTVNLKRVTG